MFRPIACRVIASLAACLAGVAGAADLSTLIDRAASASEATVLLVPSMTFYRTRVDENRIERVACRYATSDPAAIRALVALFKAADVGVDPVYQVLDLREGVYLTLGDGSLLKFFLQDNFGGALPVRGLAETSASGTVQSMAITAKRSLAADLRSWAAMLGDAGSGNACDRPPQSPVHADPVETRP